MRLAIGESVFLEKKWSPSIWVMRLANCLSLWANSTYKLAILASTWDNLSLGYDLNSTFKKEPDQANQEIGSDELNQSFLIPEVGEIELGTQGICLRLKEVGKSVSATSTSEGWDGLPIQTLDLGHGKQRSKCFMGRHWSYQVFY